MKDIPGYEGLYAIEEDGRVWSYRSKTYLTSYINAGGYYEVNLRKNNINKRKRIHRLLAETYIPNPENYSTVDHIDRNRLNNSLKNLRWASMSMQSINQDRTLNSKIASEKMKAGLVKPLKPVKRIDKYGNEKIYKSIADGVDDTYKYDKKKNAETGIWSVCNGKYKSYKGYRWEYIESTE